MKIDEVAKVLSAEVICGHDAMYHEVEVGFASDLMSDVLTLDSDKVLLITGLSNLQTIRTAEMADINCIIFARGKKISPEMKRIAIENNMVVLECKYSVFKTAGLLFNAGIQPIY